MKKLIAIVLALSLMLSVTAFADTTTSAQIPAVEKTTAADPASTEGTQTQQEQPVIITVEQQEAQPTQKAGITPDSVFYSLDRLMEKIQLSLITDAVKHAEILAKIAQERLAESNEMTLKSDLKLAQTALEEYKANLEQAVKLIETAMESGKQVADVMGTINAASLKDAAVVEKILTSIPEEYRVAVKEEIEKIATATDAANETAIVVENKKVEDSSLKKDITNKLIEEKVKDAALIAKIQEAGLNTRQVIAIISLSEQSEKPLAEVIDMFLKNERGIGATAHELGLPTKDALKGINSSFKDAKNTIKQAFKEALKTVDEKDKDDVEAIVNSSLADKAEAAKVVAAKEDAKAAAEKLEKVVNEAKAQVVAITAATKGKKLEKAVEKVEKEIDKLEKKIEKSEEKLEKDKHENKSEKANENGKDNRYNSEKHENNGKSNKQK